MNDPIAFGYVMQYSLNKHFNVREMEMDFATFAASGCNSYAVVLYLQPVVCNFLKIWMTQCIELVASCSNWYGNS